MFKSNEFSGSAIFILPALVPAVIFASLIELLIFLVSGDGSPARWIWEFWIAVFYILLAGELLLLLIYVPILYGLQAFGWLNRWTTFAVASLLPVGLGMWGKTFGMFLFFGLYCYLTYVFYWMLCRRWLPAENEQASW